MKRFYVVLLLMLTVGIVTSFAHLTQTKQDVDIGITVKAVSVDVAPMQVVDFVYVADWHIDRQVATPIFNITASQNDIAGFDNPLDIAVNSPPDKLTYTIPIHRTIVSHSTKPIRSHTQNGYRKARDGLIQI